MVVAMATIPCALVNPTSRPHARKVNSNRTPTAIEHTPEIIHHLDGREINLPTHPHLDGIGSFTHIDRDQPTSTRQANLGQMASVIAAVGGRTAVRCLGEHGIVSPRDNPRSRAPARAMNTGD